MRDRQRLHQRKTHAGETSEWRDDMTDATVTGTTVGCLDKVTLITGGSMGIGAGCARVFVAAGARVAICARGREAGEALAAELTARGPGECRFEPADVMRPEDIEGAIERTVERYGRLDCLINNAGWHPDHRPIDEYSVADFEYLLRLNLVSYFVASKYALPHLRTTRGSIINVSSLVGEIGQERAVTYVATKAAIIGMTKALSIDEAKHGVRVNVVLPGTIATPLLDHFIESKPNPQAMKAFLDSWQWMGRVGAAAEVGYACLFLASDQASYITGTELIVSGGQELGHGIKGGVSDFRG
jgi:NAD(P)-dependent dehydrogenase (short-subunit alcohol dehydrogenase family)